MVFIPYSRACVPSRPTDRQSSCLCRPKALAGCFADNEGSLLVSRRAGVIGRSDTGSFLPVSSTVLVYFPFLSFLKTKTKTFICIFLGGVAFIPGLFLFLEFLPGYLFSPV